MKKILLISTGGTIASMPTDGGLTPQINSSKLLEYLNFTKLDFEIETVNLLNVDSTDMQPEHWLKIKDEIKNNYDKYDGFVITHGTDTMAYTASALSYLIQNSQKPIVLTGSQKSIDMHITDAKNNLLNSLVYASKSTSKGISIVFDGKVISAEDLLVLAQLPSKEELLSKLAGSLLGIITKLAVAVDQVRIKKEEGAE